MTYTFLAVVAVLAAVAVDVFVLRTRLTSSATFWLSYLIIFGFQLVVNGILTGYRIVTYDPATIIGLRVVQAPVEDLAFGFAMTLTTLMTWTAHHRDRAGRRDRTRWTASYVKIRQSGMIRKNRASSIGSAPGNSSPTVRARA